MWPLQKIAQEVLTATAVAVSSCCRSSRLCSEGLLGGGCLKALLSRPVIFSFSDSAATLAVATSSFSSCSNNKLETATSYRGDDRKNSRIRKGVNKDLDSHSETPRESCAVRGAQYCPQRALQQSMQNLDTGYSLPLPASLNV